MSELLEEIGRRIAASCTEAYFVGGCVRDLLRGEPIKDVDVALSGDVYAAGRALAGPMNGHVFWLRQDEGVVRVILPEHEGLQLDLCALRGTLQEDLRARDLTINALAIAAADGLRADAPLLDPMHGQADLAAGLIRFCTPQSPVNDPLRTLRALRFRWKLDFRTDPATDAQIRACVPGLGRVSVERIRDELFQLLAIPQADAALTDCLAYGMGQWLFGREVSVGSGAAEGVRALLALLVDTPPELGRLLATSPTPPRTRRELLLWAAALQPVDPPLDPAAVARHLALSSDERQLLAKGLAASVQVRALVPRWPVAGRVRYRLFRSAGNAGPEAVLLAAAADGAWTQAHAELLDEALQRHFWPEPPLLTGIEVMQILDTKPGPRVGQALEEVEEARADGILHTKAEAVAWLRVRCQPTS